MYLFGSVQIILKRRNQNRIGNYENGGVGKHVALVGFFYKNHQDEGKKMMTNRTMLDKFKDCWLCFGNWRKDYRRHFNCSGKDNSSIMNLKYSIYSSKHILKHYLFSLVMWIFMLNENCSILQLTYMLHCWWHEEQRKRWKPKQSGRCRDVTYYQLHTYFFVSQLNSYFTQRLQKQHWPTDSGTI